jgi:hypothetical protein
MLVNPAAHVDGVDSAFGAAHPAHNRLDSALRCPQNSQAGGDYSLREVDVKSGALGGVHFSALNARKTVHF